MNNEGNNDAINPSVKDKKSQTFNLIIGVATLLIAILGATFAYFTATARSREGEVTVRSAMVSINFDRGTAIKANNLIPSSERIALLKYQKEVVAFDPDIDGDYIQDYDEYIEAGDLSDINRYLDRRCIDANAREVCYVFWFSVTSDGEDGDTTDILSYIKVERNEFENLSYLVYEVDYVRDENNEVVKDKYGLGMVSNYRLISNFLPDESFPIQEEIPFARFGKVEGIYEGDNLTGTMNPVACLFGEVDNASEKAKDDSSRCRYRSLENNVEHDYQIVIWLEETGSEQLEQGKFFNGTVSVEVSGENNADGRVTGKE